MDSSIITAMISLIGTLGGSLGGILVSSKLTAYRLEQLEARVAEHNNFALLHTLPRSWLHLRLLLLYHICFHDICM